MIPFAVFTNKSKYINTLNDSSKSIIYGISDSIVLYIDQYDESKAFLLNNQNYFIFCTGYIYYLKNENLNINRNRELFLNNIINEMEESNFKENKYFDGQYACIIYIKKEQKLVFFTDVFGLYPLYYVDNSLLISNSIRLLHKIKNNVALLKYYIHKTIIFKELIGDDLNTIYQDISKTGFYKIYYYNKKIENQCENYFDHEISKNKTSFFESTILFKNALKKSIESILRYFNKPLFDFSGGVDSSSIVALALQSNIKQKIFTWKAVMNSLEPTNLIFEPDNPFTNSIKNNYTEIDINNCLFLDNADELLENYYGHYFPNTSLLYLSFLKKQRDFLLNNNFDCAVSGFYSEHLLNIAEPYFIIDLFRNHDISSMFSKTVDYCRENRMKAENVLLNYLIKPLFHKPVLSFFEIPKWIKDKQTTKEIIKNAKYEIYSNIIDNDNCEISSLILTLKRSLLPFGIPNTIFVPYISPFLNKSIFEIILKLDRQEILDKNLNSDRILLRKAMKEELPSSIVNNELKSTAHNREIQGVKKNYHLIKDIFKNSILAELNIIDINVFSDCLQQFKNDSYRNIRIRDHIIRNIFPTLAMEIFLQVSNKRGINII